MKIIIVESPAKSKTIEGYMGEDYKVVASYGHIRDLATSGKGGLGIDIPKGFIPTYVVSDDKKNTVKELKKVCQNNQVFLATDPDREGEAISWHLASVLDLDVHTTSRVVFNEITKEAVKEAFDNPRHLDLNLVSSQETRRMLDRIIGFKLSSLLQRKIKSKSAGRVQSSALKIIVDLEKEINAFIPVAYYELDGLMDDKYKIEHVNSKLGKIKYDTYEEAKKVYDSLGKDFTVKDIIVKQSKTDPRPPLITSTLQQEASNKHSYSPDRTMRIAQALYEGKEIGAETIGLITYMRTDSTRLSDVFINDTNKFIQSEFGKEYLGSVKVKKSKNQQDAHEAIRPSSVMRTPKSIQRYLTKDELNIYTIIYNRAVGSLMSAAQYENTTILFDNNSYNFKLVGRKLKFPGFRVLSPKKDDEEIPNFNIKQVVNNIVITLEELYTKPKSRFTQASLIKAMEELGIGRPSTYAQTVRTLISRLYIEINEGKIFPTEQGIITTEKLEEFFEGIIAPTYTAKMETTLDEIANGEKNNIEELTEFYDHFNPLYETALENMEKLPDIPTGEYCPVCNNELVIKKGRYGDFTSCKTYPECKYIKKDVEIEVEEGILCPNCRKGHIVNRVAGKGANKGKVFYACNNYPKCKTSYDYKPLEDYCDICGSVKLEAPDGLICSNKNCGKDPVDEVTCPVCNKGQLVEKVASRGKNSGNSFFACNNFPKCRTAFSFQPLNKKCDVCNSIMLLKEDSEICSNDKCDTNKDNS
ncbi:MAG: type I DNA topoisomerase [bacterium]